MLKDKVAIITGGTRGIEREKLAKARAKAIENENKYRELKGKFFGIFFTDGTFQDIFCDAF